MSWNINLTVATAASGGDIPISDATISWIDGGTSHSINNSSAFSPSNEAGTVTVSVNQASTNFTATCTGFSPQTLGGNSSTGSLLFQLAATGGGGTTGCFIATAAYGSDSAPEVKFLQDFRDNVLRRTRWGHKFFQELWKHYYHISPPISQEMDRDPELRRVIRWAIVDPWLNYIKLMMSRPDFKALNLDGLDPKLREFLVLFQGASDKWLEGIELPKSFKGRDPKEAIDELNIVVGLVLLPTAGRAYLKDLHKNRELPLHYPKEDEAGLKHALTQAGRTEEEIRLILHG